jgi:hypothetical protein
MQNTRLMKQEHQTRERECAEVVLVRESVQK